MVKFIIFSRDWRCDVLLRKTMKNKTHAFHALYDKTKRTNKEWRKNMCSNESGIPHKYLFHKIRFEKRFWGECSLKYTYGIHTELRWQDNTLIYLIISYFSALCSVVYRGEERKETKYKQNKHESPSRFIVTREPKLRGIIFFHLGKTCLELFLTWTLPIA